MKNKYLLLISGLGTLALLRQRRSRKVSCANAPHPGGGRSEEGVIPVQLRQIVNPALGASDRCVSCHVTMGPGEQSVSGSKVLVAHRPVVHDPAEYGCTVCHGGQGQATEKADAHGAVEFWPQPMLPARSSYAGCGTCHSAIGVPESKQLEAAQLAFERLDCLGLPSRRSRGGTIRPGGGGMEGPDLSRSGLAGYDADGTRSTSTRRRRLPRGLGRLSLRFGESDQALLAVYMTTRTGASQLVAAKAVFHSSAVSAATR